ncbi:hypothetical protein OIU79_026021 [Salix purpurea]|uniref:Uncharacterized protein n=1 Tax=Salix purpurea TaxID=77065 RepID=A0A9Q0W6I1_SALPP|nr:hypothetical protein OIU79_026021 [Salix purpurea]
MNMMIDPIYIASLEYNTCGLQKKKKPTIFFCYLELPPNIYIFYVILTNSTYKDMICLKLLQIFSELTGAY